MVEQVQLSSNLIKVNEFKCEQIFKEYIYQTNKMKSVLFNSIDKRKLISLVAGIAVIYFTFLIGGVLHQYILKQKYVDRFNGRQSYFNEAVGLIAVEKAIIFIFGFIYNLIALPKQSRKTLPVKNNLFCALTVFLSSVTNNYAMILVSYPIVVMFKSCNILSVILVGVLCSRVRDKSLRLGDKKIIVAIMATIGIVMFKVFDPEAKGGADKKIQIVGLVFLLISLLADGFLPDFQAEIKEKYNPEPTVMMVEINKWCFLVSLAYLIVSGHMISFAQFAWRHPSFVYHLLAMSCLSFVGQIFIYRMIREFKQHIVPFVITTRKIISVGISVIYFRHNTNWMQMLGVGIVFITTLYEFLNEILKPNQDSMSVYEGKFSGSIEESDESAYLKNGLRKIQGEDDGEIHPLSERVKNNKSHSSFHRYEAQLQLQQQP